MIRIIHTLEIKLRIRQDTERVHSTDLLTPIRSPNALPLHTRKQFASRGSSWGCGSSILICDH